MPRVPNPEAGESSKMKPLDQKKMQMIQLIKEYPILYDLNHIDFKNSQTKQVIWEQIAKTLGETGEYDVHLINHNNIMLYEQHFL